MALFGSKKKIETKPTAKVDAKAVVVLNPKQTHSVLSVADVILRPHITEKAGMQNELNNVYTFQVYKDANKDSVAKAVRTLYKVTPTAVRMVNLKGKKVLVRGKKGTQSGLRKAYVTLKKGDKIEVA